MRIAARVLPAALAVALTAPAAAFAQDLAPLDRYWLGLGGYSSDNDLDIRIDGEDGVAGSNVDFQRDLGFDERETAFAYDLGFTLADRHQLAVTGHRYSSEAGRTLSRELDIDDEIYAVDAVFAGEMDIDLTSVSYTWFFHSNERSAFGVGLGGVHYALDADLAASAVADDGEGGEVVTTVGKRIDESAWAPMIRAQYSQVIDDHWRFNVELAGVRKSGGSVSGDAVDASASIDYFPWKHFGFSLKYNYNDVSLKYKKTSYRGKLDLVNQGPQLLAVVKF